MAGDGRGTVGADRLAGAQGLYLLVTGVWPLVHYRSFEAITGPKADRWLVQTVAGLTATIGWTMLRSRGTPAGRAAARRLGVGSALAFGAIDSVYGGSGRIRRVYLADALVEAGWLAAWGIHAGSPRPRPGDDVPVAARHIP